MGTGASKVATKEKIDYLNEARTGDVLLFISDCFEIKCFTGSPYTHIGVILRDDTVRDAVEAKDLSLPSRNSGIYVLHSMNKGHNPKDLLTNKNKDGPQLQRLETVWKRWSNNVIRVRKIRVHDRRNPFEGKGQQILDFAERVNQKHYERSLMQMFNATTALIENEEDLSSYFCSELVAQFYKEFGVMKTKEPSNEFVPASFTPSHEEDLKLAQGISFSPIYELVAFATNSAKTRVVKT